MDELMRVVQAYVIKEYLEEGDDQEITWDTPLITGGIVDSFSMVSLRVFLERKYGIHIPDEEASPAAFDTVRRIAELVTRIRQGAAKAAAP